MGMVLSTCARDGAVDTIADLVNVGGTGTLEFYTTGMATLLAELTFSSTAFLASSNGIATANAVASDTSANNTGLVSMFRIINGDGSPVVSGSVSTTASDSDIVFSDTAVIMGDTIQLDSLTLTIPTGSL